MSSATRRTHFGPLVGDLAAAHERVLAAATAFVSEYTSPKPDPESQQATWRVYQTGTADYIFCLVIR